MFEQWHNYIDEFVLWFTVVVQWYILKVHNCLAVLFAFRGVFLASLFGYSGRWPLHCGREPSWIQSSIITVESPLTATFFRLREVPHFSSGIVERAKRERAWKSPHARKAIRGGKRGKIFSLFSVVSWCCGHQWRNTKDWKDTEQYPHLNTKANKQYFLQHQETPLFSLSSRVSSFLAWGDFHARSRFIRSTIPEEKWGTTHSLLWTVEQMLRTNDPYTDSSLKRQCCDYPHDNRTVILTWQDFLPDRTADEDLLFTFSIV